VDILLTLTLDEILKAVKGELYQDGTDYTYKNITTDTRKLEPGSLFIALRGENFNGNKFAVEASNKGACICIVDEILFGLNDINKSVTIIKVENTKEALKNLAKYYRSKLSLKVIGITGSTGKTSTKDLVAAVLSSKFKVFKTKGNFNNEIGLPLMIFNLDDTYEVAVLEMGMSNLGEIRALADIARPDIGIITNIGISHIENLKTRENILKAKMEIAEFFNGDNTLIVNGDNDLLDTIKNVKYNLIKIGTQKEFDYTALNIILNEENIKFEVNEKRDYVSGFIIDVPVPGRHNILNSLLAVSCGRCLGLNYDEISKGIRTLEATSRRLDIIKKNSITIVDDCYNASPDSMRAALDVISNIKGKRRIAVLGTMKELGENAFKYHEEIGSYAAEKHVDLFITVGEYSEAFKKGYNNNDNFKVFNDNETASKFIAQNLRSEDIILVKASRSMEFETIVEKLKN
jgi:UDP-N-acetylmuramoyl-tripeptide--D-alanyl-D-alanine ligase